MALVESEDLEYTFEMQQLDEQRIDICEDIINLSDRMRLRLKRANSYSVISGYILLNCGWDSAFAERRDKDRKYFRNDTLQVYTPGGLLGSYYVYVDNPETTYRLYKIWNTCIGRGLEAVEKRLRACVEAGFLTAEAYEVCNQAIKEFKNIDEDFGYRITAPNVWEELGEELQSNEILVRSLRFSSQDIGERAIDLSEIIKYHVGRALPGALFSQRGQWNVNEFYTYVSALPKEKCVEIRPLIELVDELRIFIQGCNTSGTLLGMTLQYDYLRSLGEPQEMPEFVDDMDYFTDALDGRNATALRGFLKRTLFSEMIAADTKLSKLSEQFMPVVFDALEEMEATYQKEASSQLYRGGLWLYEPFTGDSFCEAVIQHRQITYPLPAMTSTLWGMSYCGFLTLERVREYLDEHCVCDEGEKVQRIDTCLHELETKMTSLIDYVDSESESDRPKELYHIFCKIYDYNKAILSELKLLMEVIDSYNCIDRAEEALIEEFKEDIILSIGFWRLLIPMVSLAASKEYYYSIGDIDRVNTAGVPFTALEERRCADVFPLLRMIAVNLVSRVYDYFDKQYYSSGEEEKLWITQLEYLCRSSARVKSDLDAENEATLDKFFVEHLNPLLVEFKEDVLNDGVESGKSEVYPFLDMLGQFQDKETRFVAVYIQLLPDLLKYAVKHDQEWKTYYK
ncbi:MAG: hypothetical protein KA961_07300 [Bacteroides sp.]|nr:hypothetical protein [Bacteroides sp.]